MRTILLFGLLTLCVSEDYVPSEYLIGLKPSTDVWAFSTRLKSEFGIELKKSWNLGKVKILHVSGEEKELSRIGQLTEVKYWERNGYAHAVQECQKQPAPGCWGLDRIDQEPRLSYNDPLWDNATYIWGERTAIGVNAYVLDTGIDITHYEFEGRARWGYTASGIPSGEYDGNGHGTHVSGTIGGASYGVAKGVNLIAVKVLDDSGSGPWSSVLDGMEWVRLEAHQPGDRSVVSMSLGGSGSEQSILDAVDALYEAGVVVVVAAGNDNMDACSFTPSQAYNAITVGATEVTDVSARFTNWGACVDIFAPGVDVLSTYPGNDTAILSGTSMATPHVTGVVARYQGYQSQPPLPSNVVSWLKTQATRDAISWSGSNHDQSPNLLLYANC